MLSILLVFKNSHSHGTNRSRDEVEDVSEDVL